MKASELVLLHLGPWVLAVPRREVRDLLAPDQIAFDSATPGAGASILFGARRLPVLVLDDTLQVTQGLPAGRRICVVLDTGAVRFALLCDEFEHKLDSGQGALSLHALPPAMRAPRSPVNAVLQYGDAVAAVTDAHMLLKAFEPQLSLAMELV